MVSRIKRAFCCWECVALLAFAPLLLPGDAPVAGAGWGVSIVRGVPPRGPREDPSHAAGTVIARATAKVGMAVFIQRDGLVGFSSRLPPLKLAA